MSRFENYGSCNECKIKKDFLICSECCKCICNECLLISNHSKCQKCQTSATCDASLICYNCQINHYDMITNLIAVGDCESSYDDFDIIINLFLEDNGCDLNQVIYVEDNGKKIYNLGLIDRPEYKDTALYLLTYIIPELVSQENKKILFHCYAGVSRSATFAIAFLMATHKLSIEDAYDLVKSKRSIIHPNYGFIEALNEFSRIIVN
jgi:hypothetical protein